MVRPGTLLLLVICIGAVAPVRATTLVPADLGELSRDAYAIARGRVVTVEARWSDDRRRLETLVTLLAETYLKGALGSSVQFRVPGGQLGRFRSIVVGAPAFAPGQYVIVFLGARGPSIPYILGLSQGLFRVERETTGWMVTPPAILPTGQPATPIVRGDPARRPMALDHFERQVRALAGGAR